MRAEIQKKAKAAKKAPAFEVLDVPEAERERGKRVEAYQQKKELEA